MIMDVGMERRQRVEEAHNMSSIYSSYVAVEVAIVKHVFVGDTGKVLKIKDKSKKHIQFPRLT